MQKKIMALILVVPLLFLLIIYSVAVSASLNVPIPANGIEITSWTDSDGTLSFDLAEYKNNYVLTANVLPSQAANRGYNIAVEDENVISVDENGVVKAKNVGRTTVTVTSYDKGFKDNVTVTVYSSKATDIYVCAKDSEGAQIPLYECSDGDADYMLETGIGRVRFYGLVLPDTVQNKDITWVSADDGIKVNAASGKAEFMFSGVYYIKAKTADGPEKTIKAVVKNEAAASYINGYAASGIRKITVGAEDELARIYVESSRPLTESDVSASADGIKISVEPFGEASDVYRSVITIDNLSAAGDEFVLRLNIGGESHSLTVEKSDYSLNVINRYDGDISDNKKFLHTAGSTVTYFADVTPEGADVRYQWIAVSGDVAVVYDGASASITSGEGGVVRVVVTSKGRPVAEARFEIECVSAVGDIIMSEDAEGKKTVKGRIAVGDTVCTSKDGKFVYTQNNYVLSPTVKFNGAPVADYALTFESLTPEVVTVSADGTLNIRKSGGAKVRISWAHGEYFGTQVYTDFVFDAVKGGVSVTDERTLKAVCEDGTRPVVLNADFMLGTEVGSSEWVKSMPTTYDWTYYKNAGYLSPPTVNYILEFKNDVYGNGHYIDADKITVPSGAGAPFNGPLDFVAYGTAHVRGQDNISFLVRTDGVKIDNAVLRSCSDDSLLIDNNGVKEFNLNALNTVGTTLEIASDATLVNSRVSNGRTVVRVYGGGADANGSPVTMQLLSKTAVEQERIKVKIESCILYNAREFIIKTGANRSYFKSQDVPSPALISEDGKEYDRDVLTDKTKLTDDEYFYSHYVLTDLTVKNSALETSGLFSIGVESHFSGILLNGSGGEQFFGWTGLASTSYAAILRLEGDVRMYDWKELEKVDSSTLIEGEGLGDMLQLNIKAMLECVQKQDDKYANVIDSYNGKQMVHGGIAFYGGGKNYSRLDLSAFDMKDAYPFYNFNVNISVLAQSDDSVLNLQGTMLPLAAGTEDFSFFMYGEGSAFDYDKQLNDNRTSWIPPAII